MDEDMIKATLKYHILKTQIRTKGIVSGDIVSRPTLLQDPKYSNVTGGAQIVLTKLPSDEVVLTSGFSTRGTIVGADIPFNNGVVQVIDAVMRVPLPLATTARESYPDLVAFVGALYKLGLYEEFNSWKDITVFLPDTKAFQHLAGRFKNEDDAAFRHILKYHVVPGRVLHAWNLENGSALTTYSRGPGQVPNTITVTRNGNYIFLNSAQVIMTDLLISNGIVHVIDNVLNPGNQTALPNPQAKTQAPVFTPTGATSVGHRVATPFVTDLPCTQDCPEPEPTVTDSPRETHTPPTLELARPTSNPALPQYTGLTGHGLGLAALGALAVL
ncbi:FAS1 domain containing protein [Naviculisporaceae sp. PSN 640]